VTHHLEEGTMRQTAVRTPNGDAREASKIIEERLRLIIDTIPTIVWRKLPDGSADFFNKHFEEYTGLSLEDGMGWGWIKAFHPEDGMLEQWRAALGAGKPFEMEARLRRADGEYRWFLLRSVPLRDQKGNIVKWYGTTSDIEDLKRAEDRIRLIIDTIPTMAWTVRADGVVDFVNRRWLDYTGLSLEEEIADPTRAVHPEDLPRVMEKWIADMDAGQPSEDEIRLRSAGGEYRWFLIRTVPLRDEQGNLIKWYGLAVDIEDRKRAERESRALTDAIPQQIWSGPPDGTLDYCNDRWRSYTGLELKDLQGDGWQAMLHPDDRDRVLKAWQEAVVNGTPYEQEERHRGADGMYRWFLTRGVPLHDADGRVIRWYGTNTDIEDRKRAEEELGRVSGQLLRAQEEERRKIARDLHDSTAQHLVLLSAALERLQDSLPPRSRKLRRVFSEARELAGLALSEVRTLSYVLYPPMLEESGLEDAISHYVEGYTERTGVNADMQVSPGLGRLGRESEMALFHVVQESLTNVQRHSGSRHAHIRLNRVQNRVTLEIKDEGRGTARNANSRGHLPSGVGIPSMRERMKQIGGQLEIESTSAGTTVRATIVVNE
jgi:PAS domain S-box-containing protein